MHLARLLPALALALLSLPSCSWFGGETEDETSPAKPILVGRVSSIPADRRFVLIESYGKWDVAMGTVLTTRGTEGRTANLRVTGEAIGPFAAADLQAGEVIVGDAVYTLPTPKKPPTTASPPEEIPASEEITTPSGPPADASNNA